MASATQRPRSGAGFTILELLIALTLIAVIASLAVPAYFDRGEVTLDNACRLLAEDLRSAQNRAIVARAPVQVVFREDGLGYRVTDASGEDLEGPAGDDAFSRHYDRNAVFEDVRILRVDCGAGRRIVYDARGHTQLGGRVILGHRSDIRSIEIQPGDGLIRIPGLTGQSAN